MDSPRSLYVLRHAKSSWDHGGEPDEDRPLAPRGRRAVALLADYVARSDIRPEIVLCSPARRTRETLEGVRPPGQAVFEPGLYGATCDQLVDRLQHLENELRSVMLVGHNPALQMLVLRLVDPERGDRSSYLADVRRKFPTGALATLRIECGWGELGAGCAELSDYVRPKALLLQ